MDAIIGAATGFLLSEYRPSGISPLGVLPIALIRVGLGNLDFQGTSDKASLGKERFQMLTSQPPCFPSDNGTIPADPVTHPATSGRPAPIVRQAIHSFFARVADFFRRKKGSTTWLWSLPAGRSSMDPITVIGLVTSDEDSRLLTGICSRNQWNLLFVDTCEEARIALHKLKAPVVLCDRDLPGKGWRGTVEDLASSPHHVCIILVSEVVDTYLWNEVVRTGGFDVLSKPLREEDVVRAVRLAWSYWNSATRTAGIPAPREARES
jgi:CheY-like chemotaxis protein